MEYRIIRNDELLHYGVKGMRWGVRKDAEYLAKRRRNETIRKAKDEYEGGKISKEQLNDRMKRAEEKRKQYLKTLKREYESASKARKAEISKRITKQAYKEVPNLSIKKGSEWVRKLGYVHVIGAKALTAGLAIAASPALAATTIGSLAGSTAVELGKSWIAETIFDRLA